MAIAVPEYVRGVLQRLRENGYAAFPVGGCVRDAVLGVEANDWDICTAALPEELMRLFPHSIPTGIRHGTVTVKCAKKKLVEVTTFRTDGDYSDHRRPDSVTFVGDLVSDLSRRDFTMNAMALAPDGQVIDPFGGLEDIEKRLIRCVGSPEKRFEEDALRMLRAFRFAARLGFAMEENTAAAIYQKAGLCASLAAERVREETEKVLLTSPEYLYRMAEAGLLDSFLLHRSMDKSGLCRLSLLPKNAVDRWAGLCSVLLRSGCISSAEEFAVSLRLDGKTVRSCRDSAAMLGAAVPESRADIKRLLHRYGTDSVRCAAACRDALDGTDTATLLDTVLNSGECYCVKQLAVSGADLLRLDIRGPSVGAALEFLLDRVIEYPSDNTKEKLMRILSEEVLP